MELKLYEFHFWKQLHFFKVGWGYQNGQGQKVNISVLKTNLQNFFCNRVDLHSPPSNLASDYRYYFPVLNSSTDPFIREFVMAYLKLILSGGHGWNLSYHVISLHSNVEFFSQSHFYIFS